MLTSLFLQPACVVSKAGCFARRACEEKTPPKKTGRHKANDNPIRMKCLWKVCTLALGADYLHYPREVLFKKKKEKEML